MRSLRYVTLFIFVLVVGAGCDLFQESESTETLSGTWQGTITKQDSSYTLTLDLQHDPTSNVRRSPVAGHGRLKSSATEWNYTVDGTVNNRTLSMTLTFESSQPGHLNGTVDAELQTVEAEMYGGPVGFFGQAVTLEKQ